MKKLYFLIPVVLAFACSDNENGGKSCTSDLSSLKIASNSIYTGEIVSLGTASVCVSEELVVTVNDQTVETSKDDTGVISFVVPALAESVANIKISAGSSEVTLNPVDVVQAAGTWKEVASFPGTARVNMVNFSNGADGYLYGGFHYDQNSYVSYQDLYKFNPEGNAWTLVTNNVAFTQNSEAVADNKLFMAGNTYSVTDNTFGKISPIYYNPAVNSWETRYFNCNNGIYAISSLDRKSIEVQKYASGTNTWSVVKQMPYDPDDYYGFDFAVEYSGKVFISVHAINSYVSDIFLFDGASNSLTKVSDVSNDIQGSSHGLKFMFTLNGLGYFVETGESSMDNNGKVSIIKARSYFYVYDFVKSEWHKVQTEFPTSMYGVAALNVGNRGFAGLSATEGTTSGFVYSQKFFEFVPTR